MFDLLRLFIAYLIFLGVCYSLHILSYVGIASLVLSFGLFIYLLIMIREFKKIGDKTGGCALEILFIFSIIFLINGIVTLTINTFIN